MNSSYGIIHNTHVQTENTPLLPQVNRERSLSQRVYDAIFCSNTSDPMSEEEILEKKIKEWHSVENQGGSNGSEIIDAYRNNHNNIIMSDTKTLPDVFDVEKFKTNIKYFRSNGLKEFPPSFGHLHSLKKLEIEEKTTYNILARTCTCSLSLFTLPMSLIFELAIFTVFCPCFCLTSGWNGENGTRARCFKESDFFKREIKASVWEVKDFCHPSRLDLSVLRNFSNLEVLQLFNISLTTIPEEIRSLTNLKKFGFGTQKPFFIPEWIGELLLLETLELKNGINSIPSSIGNLTNLKKITISHNPLSYFPESLKQLISLQYLSLNSTSINEIPSWIDHLTSLESLTIKKSNISSLPQSLLNLQNLYALVIEESKITDLPEWFGRINLSILSLSKNSLKSLPEPIKNITNLLDLDLSQNSLVSLPDWIGTLTELNFLHLQENKLESLPETIGNLSRLNDLDLSNNKLCYLPDSLGNIRDLVYLNAYENKLLEIPSSLGNLTALRHASFYRNPSLRSLPMTLGNCSFLTFIDISDTQVPENQVNAIYDRARLLRIANSVQTFPILLRSWLLYAKKTENFNFLFDTNHFSQEQQGNINEWLLRLEVTKDYTKVQESLAVLVCNILDSLRPSTSREAVEFKNAFFGHLDGNLTQCGDRAAMLLNIIYTDWQLLMIHSNASENTKMHLLVGIAKTLTLRKILQEELSTIRSGRGYEIVESYLYYEIRLKNILGLETAINFMIYEEIGRIDSIDEKALVLAVNSRYIDTLCNLPAVDSILEKNQEFSRKKHQIIEATSQEMSALEDRRWEHDDAYVMAVNLVKEKRESELALLKKHSLLQILKK